MVMVSVVNTIVYIPRMVSRKENYWYLIHYLSLFDTLRNVNNVTFSQKLPRGEINSSRKSGKWEKKVACPKTKPEWNIPCCFRERVCRLSTLEVIYTMSKYFLSRNYIVGTTTLRHCLPRTHRTRAHSPAPEV